MARSISLPCHELRDLYERGVSTVALARRYRCSPTTVSRQLRRCGVALRPARFQPGAVDAALLRRLYLDERLPVAQIASQLGISISGVGNWRRRHGIPRRPRQAVTQAASGTSQG